MQKKILGVTALFLMIIVMVMFLIPKKEMLYEDGVSLSWNYIGESTAPTSFPTKEDGYIVDSVSCTNGNGTWDEESWGIRVSNLTGSTKCTVTFDDIREYHDNSGANYPELIEGLIPVTWNGSDWVKADTSTEWYNYDTQMWANAVTVTSASRSEYNSAAANTIISMDDIETMWVWIPRYSYTIGNTYGVQGYGGSTPSEDTPGAIDIKFVDSATKELGSAQYSGSTPSEWRTPDGFTFGDEELSGIWVGKFESSPDPVSTCFTSSNSTNCNVGTVEPMIKPNVKSWRYVNVSNAFTVSQKLTAEGNRYGLSTSADSHMMKNSEWGVVAYLSQSKYGKYGNTDYTGANKEVYKNNSSSYYTGRSQGSAPPSSSYSSAGSYTYEVDGSGTGASTTGTIYGVYDMSGGAWEYTMSNYNGTLNSYDGFSKMPESKYYDLYTTTDASTACDGGICYGHALSETGGWYNDFKYMVVSYNPWAQRGGAYYSSSNAGVFGFSNGSGVSGSSNSFRLALVGA